MPVARAEEVVVPPGPLLVPVAPDPQQAVVAPAADPPVPDPHQEVIPPQAVVAPAADPPVPDPHQEVVPPQGDPPVPVARAEEVVVPPGPLLVPVAPDPQQAVVAPAADPPVPDPHQEVVPPQAVVAPAADPPVPDPHQEVVPPQGDPPAPDPPGNEIEQPEVEAQAELPVLVMSAVDQSKLMLRKMGIHNPKKFQVKELLPLIEIKEQVSNASSKLKKIIFRWRSGGTQVRYGQKSAIARAIKLCRNSVFPDGSPKKSTDRHSLAVSKMKAVDEFYRREDNSYILPDKKHYRNAEDLTGSFVVALVDTLRNLHRKFVVETGIVLSFSTFTKARRRKTIKTSVFLKRSVCLCQTHANMGMMLEVVPGLDNSTTQMVALTNEEVRAALDSLAPRESVRFKRWGKESRVYKNKIVYHTLLRKVRLDTQDFILLFMEDLVHFREHHRRVGEQYAAVRLLKSILAEDHAICHMDYAENWGTSYMAEVQSAFYGKDQLTLHPMVVYYRHGETLKHFSYVGVSEVTQHAFPTTLAFVTKVLGHIKDVVPGLQHLHMVTDSPSSQYRNRFSCEMLRRATEMFGIRITWNWLEAGHGKGPCDGVGGALKGLADRVVKSCGSIQTADEFVEVLRPQTQKITLIRVWRAEVEQCERVVKEWKSRKVDTISLQHQATVYDSELYIRTTSCYQECCMVDGELTPKCASWRKVPTKPPPRPRAARATQKRAPARAAQASTSSAPSQPPPAASDLDSDSDPDSSSDWEDEVGANQAGVMEEVFSSDDEGCTDVEQSAHRSRRLDDRRKRREFTLSRTAKAGARLAAATAESEAESGTDVVEDGSSSSDSDPDYTPELETPEDAARNAVIAQARRNGEVVNELLCEGDTSSDDWPIAEACQSVASYLKLNLI